MRDLITPDDVFLSYNWRDDAVVEGIARHLQSRGLTVFLDRWYLVPGRPEAYEAMGGVQGAIASWADGVFAQLSRSDQEVARQAFVQLVRPGEGTEDTRRRATFAEVGEAARPVVQRLADARLLVTGRDAGTGEETVEVAHEALIRTWMRLRNWMDADREFLLSLIEWILSSSRARVKTTHVSDARTLFLRP